LKNFLAESIPEILFYEKAYKSLFFSVQLIDNKFHPKANSTQSIARKRSNPFLSNLSFIFQLITSVYRSHIRVEFHRDIFGSGNFSGNCSNWYPSHMNKLPFFSVPFLLPPEDGL